MPFERFSARPDHSESANTRRYTPHPDATGEVLQTETAYLPLHSEKQRTVSDRPGELKYFFRMLTMSKLWNVERSL